MSIAPWMPKGAARHTQFAVAGAVLALQDAGISREELQRADCAIMIGATLMDFGAVVGFIDSIGTHGLRGATPRSVYTMNIASIPGAVNHVFGISARSMAMQSTCCRRGSMRCGPAGEFGGQRRGRHRHLRRHRGAPLHRHPLLEFRSAGLTPPTTDMPERLDRPFDLWRTTGVISEGACIFVIEAEESRRPGYGYITGYSFATDKPGDLCSGIATANRLALAEARLRPGDIDAISAWGPGHKLVDAGEARALMSVFGPALDEIPTASIKGAIGNPLSAAAAMQIAAAALGMREGIMPPTVNWDFPDPACPLQS